MPVYFSLYISPVILFLAILIPGLVVFMFRNKSITLSDLFVMLGIDIATVSLISMMLIELDQFVRKYLILGLVGIALSYALFMLWKKRKPSLYFDLRIEWSLGIFVLIMVLSAAVRLPVSHYVYGGQDQGIYVNVGHQLAQHGTLKVYDPIVRILGSSTQTLSYIPSCSMGQWLTGDNDGCRAPGTYVSDLSTGEIFPLFFHLFPAWLAISELMFGSGNAVLVAMLFFSLLTVAAFYGLVRLFIRNRYLQLAGLLICSINILQVWINRYPLSETLTQFMLVAGLYLLASNRGRLERVITSAVLLGLISFVRGTGFIEYVLLLPIFILNLARLPRRENILFLVVMFGTTGYALVHAMIWSGPYLRSQFQSFMPLYGKIPYLLTYPNVGVLLILSTTIASVALFVLFSKTAKAVASHLILKQHYYLGALAILFVLGLFVRMLVSGIWFDQTITYQFVCITSPILFVLSFIGLMLPRKEIRSEIMLSFGIIFLFYLFFQHLNWFTVGGKHLYYYGRYNIVEIYTFMNLFALIALERLIYLRFGRSIVVLVLGMVLLGYGLPYFSNPTYLKEESDGAFEGVSKIVEVLPSDAITLVAADPSTSTHTFTARLPMALQYTFDQPALAVSLSSFQRDISTLYDRLTDDHRLYLLLLSDTYPRTQQLGDYSLTLVQSGKLALRASDMSPAPPDIWWDFPIPYRLYEVGHNQEYHFTIQKSPFVTIENDISDPPYKFFWTQDATCFSGFPPISGDRVVLDIETMGYYLPKSTSTFTVSLNNEDISNVEFSGKEGLKNLPRIEIDSAVELDKESRICVSSKLWIPRDYGTADGRELGIDISSISVQVTKKL